MSGGNKGPRVWGIAVLLGVIGFALNLLEIALLPGIALLLGDIPALVGAVALGPAAGALAAAIAASRTVFLWGHPFGILLFALQAAAVGALVGRVRPVFAVALFWAVVGLPLGALAYTGIMDVAWPITSVILLKQVLNGLVEVLIAEALLLSTLVRAPLGLQGRPAVRRYLGVLTALAAVIPLVTLWVFHTRTEWTDALDHATREARLATRSLASVLAEALAEGEAARIDPAEIARLSFPGAELYAANPEGLLVVGTGASPGRAPDSHPGYATASRVAGQGRVGVALRMEPGGRSRVAVIQSYDPILVAAERVPGPGWVAWTEVPFRRIFASIAPQVLAGEVLAVIALLISLELARRVARRVEDPLHRLMEAAGRLEAGELSARVGPDVVAGAPAEPAALAGRFNAMAEQLERTAGERERLLAREREARGEAERRAEEEAALREAAAAVSASFTVEETVRRIAGSALTATRADGAFVERLESGDVVVVASAGDAAVAKGVRNRYEGSYTQEVIEGAKPVAVSRLAEAERSLPDDLGRRFPDHSGIFIPLLDAGEAIGALVLLRSPEKESFRPDEIERANTFGELASLAFRRIHLFEESERRREELQEVTESRARLMRGFSHDVKNPLGAADGHLQLLEMGVVGESSEKQRESIARARRSIRAALGLIEDLLELARAETAQVELECAPSDMREAAREVVEEFRAQAEAKGLRISIDLPDQAPLIESDPARIRQVISNLVSNAVKYTASGLVTVRVEEREAGPLSGAGRWVAVAVSDTGPGIPADKQHLLFREFTRLKPEEAQGAGVGLAISKRIASALGGDITVRSEAGEGSTFTLWLPVTRGPVPRGRQDEAA